MAAVSSPAALVLIPLDPIYAGIGKRIRSLMLKNDGPGQSS